MAGKRDYFGMGYLISVILAIIPITSWILGFMTRFLEGKIIAGIVRVFFGFNIIWICDIISMILRKKIIRLIPI